MRTRLIYITTIIMTLVIGVSATMVIGYYLLNKEPVIKTIKEVNITESGSIKSAIDKIYNAVLAVETYKGTRVVSTGTGFIYKQDDKYGYIITNHHVIAGATKVNVITANGEEVNAKILGSDQYADIAVLSIEKAAVLQVATIGKSDTLKLGDTLFTVGSPLGNQYRGTVTKGILSGKDRTVSLDVNNGAFIMQVLQTDAAINPGNSGGPLLNINGEVVGVNSLKLVQDTIEGMGFAIPIEIVMGSVDRLEKGEVIKRPLIGAELVDVTDVYGLLIKGITVDKSIASGVVIADVTANMPASIAGLKKGDIISEINGVKIEDIAHFRFNLYKFSIGETITVKYYRDIKLETLKILLDKSL